MSQSLSKLWVHIIFSTKKRFPFLKDVQIQKRLHDYIKEICTKQNCHTLIVGGVEDHVHLLVNLNKNTSIANLVEKIKKSTSKWIKTLNDPSYSLKKFYWQNGYGAFSVSESNIEIVDAYIKRQHEHHRKESYQDELKNFLKKHKINFDEKYLWD